MWKWIDLKRILFRKQREVDVRNLAAVMWPAVYTGPNPPREPHVTIVMLGEIEQLDYTAQDVVNAVRAVSGYSGFLLASVDDLEWFGPEQDVPVLRVSHPMLQKFRDNLVNELALRNVSYDNSYPEYKPHLTVTDEAALNGEFQDNVLLAPVEVWWGGEHIKTDF